MKLTEGEYRALLWLSRQTQLMWGGVYDRQANGDSEVSHLLANGLIEGVAKEIRVGKSVFGGGYRITERGRLALKNQESDRG